jgi:hypothetical protein
MTIIQTSEGCSGPKNDYFDQKCAFWAQMAFFGSNEPFSRPSRTFLGQKMAVFTKICLFSKENYQKRRVLVKIGPF